MADTKISALTTASALDGTEHMLLSQGAADRKVVLNTARTDLDWVRPSDWPAMPTTAANTVHMFAAVFDHASNFAAVRMSTSSGTWSIDWGDGTSDTGVASNATASHTYDYSDGDLPSATSRGYKVAVVTITADSGNFTVFNPSIAHATATGTPPWLEMQINGSAITTFTFTTNSIRLCEHINFVAHGTITALVFTNMFSLAKVTHTGSLFSNLTVMTNLFQLCCSLRRVDLTGMSASITSLQSAFQGCYSLTSITFPSGTCGSSLLTLQAAFDGCARLRSVSFPSGSLTHVTNIFQIWRGCNVLPEIVFPSGALAALTTPANAFENCFSFTRIEFPSGSLASVTSIASMFSGCASLQKLVFPSGSLGSVSTTTSAFNGCSSLSKIENCGIPVSFSVASCRLGAAALDEIYTALPSVTATITVTSNHGTSGDDPTIATGKGWTVTGS